MNMDNYLLTKRWKTILNRAVEVSNKEAHITKKLSKICEKFTTYQELVLEEIKKSNEIHEKKKKQEYLLKRFEQLCFDNEKELKYKREAAEKLQADIRKQEQETASKEHFSLNFDAMRLWLLKSAIKIHINEEFLTNIIKGFMVYDSWDGMKFHSFQIDLRQCTLHDAQEIIWKKVEAQKTEWKRVFDKEETDRLISIL